MNITLRLYWVHDYDLIGLGDHPDVNFAKYAKQALVAYATEDPSFSLHVPDGSKVRERKSNRIYHIRINLNDPEDKAAYDAYLGLKRGTRNSAIKNMVRMYMDQANFAPYITEEEVADPAPSVKASKKTTRKKKDPDKIPGVKSAAKKEEPAKDQVSEALEFKEETSASLERSQEEISAEKNTVLSEVEEPVENPSLEDSEPAQPEELANEENAGEQEEGSANIFDWFDQNLA